MKKALWILALTLLIIPVIGALYFIKVYGHETQQLINYRPPLTTKIYDRNGELIANIFDKEHRMYATFDEIPPRLIEALLAIEDTIFFEHPGINIDAIFRAILKDIKAGGMVEGASTITQQLVKNRLLSREKKIVRKLKEMLFSLKIETELSKEEILERYLNEIYLGHGYFGIKTAAEGYFRKPLDRLSLKEMAILVGLPKAPSYYSPTKNYELSLGRANRVISRMHQLGWIDEVTYIKATQERPEVFDDTLTKNRAPYVVDEVVRQLSGDFGDIRSGGYEVYTTIDLKLQEAARESLKYAYDLACKRAENDQDFNATLLNGALVSIDPSSGDVVAMVGGVDYVKSSYNRATQGLRQPGSAFKPFLFQVALDLGYSGATELADVARTYEYKKGDEIQKWQPKNYEKDYEGLMTLREALVHSRNLATINLVTDVGLSMMLGEMKRFGIKDLPHDLSLSLGSISLSPLSLAGYYTSFANHGIQVEPVLVRTVSDSFGRTASYESHERYITSPQQSYLMTTILQDVVKRGTGRRAGVRGIDIAGKTGTSNNEMDGWFAGYSPSMETVVWFGNDDNTPMRKGETGGRVAGPGFRHYYERLIRIYPQTKRHFDKPDGVIETTYKGRKEYFTEISKPPLATDSSSEEEGLIF